MDFNVLEAGIANVFSKTELSDSEKKDLIIGIIKEQLGEEESFKLFPPDDCFENSNHARFRTKNGKYSLMIAYDGSHSGRWYFYGANDPNVKHSYNSLWEGKSYETEEECVANAELWLSKVIKQAS